MSEKSRIDWDTYLFILLVAVLVILFSGEPDIGDALRAKALRWAGIEQQEVVAP